MEPRVYERGGFAVTLWTYYESVAPEVSPDDYAEALARLHAGMRKLDVTTPHFTDRVAEAEQLVVSPDRTPALPDGDRELLGNTLRSRRRVTRTAPPRAAAARRAASGQRLSTKQGLRFIDLETCCGGLSSSTSPCAPAVSERLSDADHDCSASAAS